MNERRFAAPVHGGDVAAVAAKYGGASEGANWIDFSANINPAGPPPGVIAALRAGAEDVASLVRYPSAHDRALQAALAEFTNSPPEVIVVANGAAALIEAFVRTVAPRSCMIPQPAFSEYARALAAQGCETIGFPLWAGNGFALDTEAFVAALRRERPQACMLTNPHNPTGMLAPPAGIEAILEAALDTQTAVIVDEAFVDYAPGASVVDALAFGEVLVLRSLTKFYAMPALRVGYGVAPPPFARALAVRIPSWPITSLAALAAQAALADQAYARDALAANERERAHFARALAAIEGVRVFPGAANFLFFSTPLHSSALTEALARNHRLIVRDCASYATLETGGYLRAGVRSRGDNDALVTALRAELPRPRPGAS